MSGVWLLRKGRSPRSHHLLTPVANSLNAYCMPVTAPRTELASLTETDKSPPLRSLHSSWGCQTINMTIRKLQSLLQAWRTYDKAEGDWQAWSRKLLKF